MTEVSEVAPLQQTRRVTLQDRWYYRRKRRM